MRAGRNFRTVKILKKIVLSSNASKGGCCNSETKHVRRKAPTAKLLASNRSQKEWSQP
jgi:hypothetical protein